MLSAIPATHRGRSHRLGRYGKNGMGPPHARLGSRAASVAPLATYAGTVLVTEGAKGQNYEIELRWGGWRRQVLLPIEEGGITLITSKARMILQSPARLR
jgi:hypothetical protein